MTEDPDVTWLANTRTGRAHAVKSNGRAYCGQVPDASWKPDSPGTPRCGSCVMAMDAKMEREARERGNSV